MVALTLADGRTTRAPALPLALDGARPVLRRDLPGEGELDLRGFMQALAATGTRAPIGVETFSPALDALDTAAAMAKCAAALDYCLEMAI